MAKSTTSPRATPATKGTEPVAPKEGTQEAPAQPVADEPQAPAPAASAPRKAFKLGPVMATAERLALAEVLGRLDEASLNRIAVMENIAPIIAQAERLLATDGRIAPAVFCGDGLFYGHENIVLAKLTGQKEITAVYILPEDAGAAQSFLAKQKRPSRPQPDGDEELFWQVIAHYGR